MNSFVFPLTAIARVPSFDVRWYSAAQRKGQDYTATITIVH